MLGAIQSDSTGPGRGPAEGRNTTSPSGKGREGGGEGEKGEGLEGCGSRGKRGKGVGVQVGVKLVWIHMNKIQINLKMPSVLSACFQVSTRPRSRTKRQISSFTFYWKTSKLCTTATELSR